MVNEVFWGFGRGLLLWFSGQLRQILPHFPFFYYNYLIYNVFY